MGKILEKLMKKYWKNSGKVYEKILEKCKKNWKSQGNSSVQKSGNHEIVLMQTTYTNPLSFISVVWIVSGDYHSICLIYRKLRERFVVNFCHLSTIQIHV